MIVCDLMEIFLVIYGRGRGGGGIPKIICNTIISYLDINVVNSRGFV